jgi:hypothetical protein
MEQADRAAADQAAAEARQREKDEKESSSKRENATLAIQRWFVLFFSFTSTLLNLMHSSDCFSGFDTGTRNVKLRKQLLPAKVKRRKAKAKLKAVPKRARRSKPAIHDCMINRRINVFF